MSRSASVRKLYATPRWARLHYAGPDDACDNPCPSILMPPLTIQVDDAVRQAPFPVECNAGSAACIQNTFCVGLVIPFENAKDDRCASGTIFPFHLHAASPKVRYIHFGRVPVKAGEHRHFRGSKSRVKRRRKARNCYV